MRNEDQLWYDLAYRFSEQSRCKSRKVGSVIIKDHKILSSGWNSAPKGADTKDCPRGKCNGLVAETGTSLDQAICCHSEANAIAHCASKGISTEGAQIYCTSMPCVECGKLIIGAGITEVIYDQEYNSPLSALIFKAANIKIRKFHGS